MQLEKLIKVDLVTSLSGCGWQSCDISQQGPISLSGNFCPKLIHVDRLCLGFVRHFTQTCFILDCLLRGQVAIASFVLRDTCNDSSVKLFCACFYGVSHKFVARCGVTQICLCKREVAQGGIAPFWGSAEPIKKAPRGI